MRLGDLPSKFMFQRVRHHKERSHIYMLKNSDGNWVDNQEDIATM